MYSEREVELKNFKLEIERMNILNEEKDKKY